MASFLLAEAVDDNGNHEFTPAEVGVIELFVVGTWDSASIKLQQLAPDATTWVDITTALTSNGRVIGTITHKGQMRANVASSNGSSDLDIYIGGTGATNLERTDNIDTGE